MFFVDNIGQEEVCVFLREVLRRLRGAVVVLIDNSNIHLGGPLQRLCQQFPRLHLRYFPPYAPELNPDEGVWGFLKGRLANGRPDDIGELQRLLGNEFRGLALSQQKLRGCIQQSELPLFLP